LFFVRTITPAVKPIKGDFGGRHSHSYFLITVEKDQFKVETGHCAPGHNLKVCIEELTTYPESPTISHLKSGEEIGNIKSSKNREAAKETRKDLPCIAAEERSEYKRSGVRKDAYKI
jgi:hypothetical protein